MSLEDKSNIPLSLPWIAYIFWFEIDLINISIVQSKQPTLANSKAIESTTLDESPETSEMSSSDQIASEDTSAAEASDSASNSGSDSRSSDDSDSSTDDENTTSDTDEETSEEETNSSTYTEKISGGDAQPSELLSAAVPNVGSSETISPAFVKQSETVFMSSTPNGGHTYTQNHGVSQVENWDDLKSIGKRRISASGTGSTQSESSSADLSVFGSISTKTKNPLQARDYGKSIPVQNTVDATAKFDVKSDSTSHTKSDSDKSCLHPELAGGWGEEPGPAPWDWQAMPFDYMGILEEQRRTVFYEFHEHNGKGEWIDPKYNCIPF